MIIATSITSDYLEKSQPFFDSVNKNFIGKKICFCIGFKAEYEGWEMIYVDIDTLQCKWQPENRKNYYSLQHGEFTRFYKFDDNDQIMFVDSDMILQRKFESSILLVSKFIVTNSSFPPTKIEDVSVNLNCKLSKEDFINKHQLTINDNEFCAALLIASAKEWDKLFREVRLVYKDFLEDFTHHAAWQLLINIVIIKCHRHEISSPMLQNAEWYSGTEAKVIDDVLMWKDEVVYFNHTKFNRTFKY